MTCENTGPARLAVGSAVSGRNRRSTAIRAECALKFHQASSSGQQLSQLAAGASRYGAGLALVGPTSGCVGRGVAHGGSRPGAPRARPGKHPPGSSCRPPASERWAFTDAYGWDVATGRATPSCARSATCTPSRPTFGAPSTTRARAAELRHRVATLRAGLTVEHPVTG